MDTEHLKHSPPPVPPVEAIPVIPYGHGVYGTPGRPARVLVLGGVLITLGVLSIVITLYSWRELTDIYRTAVAAAAPPPPPVPLTTPLQTNANLAPYNADPIAPDGLPATKRQQVVALIEATRPLTPDQRIIVDDALAEFGALVFRTGTPMRIDSDTDAAPITATQVSLGPARRLKTSGGLLTFDHGSADFVETTGRTWKVQYNTTTDPTGRLRWTFSAVRKLVDDFDSTVNGRLTPLQAASVVELVRSGSPTAGNTRQLSPLRGGASIVGTESLKFSLQNGDEYQQCLILPHGIRVPVNEVDPNTGLSTRPPPPPARPQFAFTVPLAIGLYVEAISTLLVGLLTTLTGAALVLQLASGRKLGIVLLCSRAVYLVGSLVLGGAMITHIQSFGNPRATSAAMTAAFLAALLQGAVLLWLALVLWSQATIDYYNRLGAGPWIPLQLRKSAAAAIRSPGIRLLLVGVLIGGGVLVVWHLVYAILGPQSVVGWTSLVTVICVDLLIIVLALRWLRHSAKPGGVNVR